MIRDIRVTFRHQVFFTHDAFSLSNPLLHTLLTSNKDQAPQKVLLVLDDPLARAQKPLVAQICAYFDTNADVLKLVSPPVLMEGGEELKNSTRYIVRLENAINRHRLDRHSYVVAVGGGALLDLVGLATALAHRGLRHVRMPSTTLSQADSGVGIKNGINAFGKKNFIGTFAPPYAVINDFELLNSLSDRDKRAGYSEAVKVALIRKAVFFEQLERQVNQLRIFEPAAMGNVIRRCAELHIQHIGTSGDPLELSSARPLDFGHWSAHKLEQLSNYQIRHGEAVAVGIALDVLYSRLAGLLNTSSAERVLGLLETLGFELFTGELLRIGPKGQLELLDGLEEFRQHLGGKLCISLIKGIGQEHTVHEMKKDLIFRAIRELQARHESASRSSQIPPT